MTSNRLTLPSRAPGKSFFTMVELIAVISITAILLTITIKIMKTDSTKANAQIIGSALKYAQAYALSKLDDADDTGDGFADDYVVVIISQADHKVTIKKFDQNNTGSEEIIEEHHLAKGSTIDNDYNIAFRTKGDPGTTTNTTTPTSATEPTTMSSQTTITITDNKNSDTFQIVRVKPFTGKVTYY